MKKLKNKKVILTIIIITQIVIILSLSTYSWFANIGNPSISANDLKITSADGLVIKLQPDGEDTTDVNLAEILSDVNQFELDQVSSADAKNFYTIDFGLGLSMQNPQFIKIEPDAYTNLIPESEGMLDLDFYLKTEDYGKSVYFANTTGLFGVSAPALRVAITIPSTDFTMIFGTSPENGIGDDFVTNAVVATGQFEYGTVAENLVSTQTVKIFSDMGGGRWENEDAEIDLSKVLVQIPANSMVKVNMKVWLEGGDPDCNETIASTYLDSVIRFASANLLLDPPDVSATTGYRINNLDTTMEYSIDSGETWIDVTDTSISFSSGFTVYVRIKEVPNVSPASYSTIINF